MKAFRYIFIIIVIVLIIFAAYSIYKQNEIVQKEEVTQNENIQQKEILTNLRLGISKYDTMNPLISNNKMVQYIDKIIFEPLLSINEDFSLECSLAKEYSKTGNTSYIIKLRDDVKWHDTMPFEARDVQFTIEKIKDGTISSIYFENVKEVSNVEIIDDHTIKINLEREIPFFEYNLTFPILPFHYYLNDDFVSTSKIPVGTGMYKIKNIESTGIELVTNDEWWNKEKTPKINNITINLYTSMGELYNAFKIGNIDLLTTTNENFSQYIGTIGFELREFTARKYDFLALNMNNNILQRKEVRQAIACSIDRNNIVASVYNNTYNLSFDPLDFGHYLYMSDVGVIEYNTDIANKIMEDNGWVLNYGTWNKLEDYRTIKTSLNLVVNSSNNQRLQVAENIKNQLENIGIEINIKAVNDNQYQSYIDNKNYDILLTGTNISASPDLSLYYEEDNLSNYSNEEIKKSLNFIKSVNDKKMLKEYYKKIEQVYQEDIPYISLYRNREYLIYNSNLMGEIKPTWYNIFYNIENWYRQI